MEHEINQYIGFWKRVGASIVDSIIMLIITAPLTYMMYGPDYWEMTETTALVQGPGDVLVNWILPVVFVIGFWILKSATPGKMLFEAVIVDAETGGKPSKKQWVIRYLGYIVSTLPLLLGFLWVAWDSRKQGFHDKMAGTVVVAEPYS